MARLRLYTEVKGEGAATVRIPRFRRIIGLCIAVSCRVDARAGEEAALKTSEEFAAAACSIQVRFASCSPSCINTREWHAGQRCAPLGVKLPVIRCGTRRGSAAARRHLRARRPARSKASLAAHHLQGVPKRCRTGCPASTCLALDLLEEQGLFKPTSVNVKCQALSYPRVTDAHAFMLRWKSCCVADIAARDQVVTGRRCAVPRKPCFCLLHPLYHPTLPCPLLLLSPGPRRLHLHSTHKFDIHFCASFAPLWTLHCRASPLTSPQAWCAVLGTF